MRTPYTSIGYYREDGAFRILATLSNRDGEMQDDRFTTLVHSMIEFYIEYTDETIWSLERQDAPDYVAVED